MSPTNARSSDSSVKKPRRKNVSSVKQKQLYPSAFLDPRTDLNELLSQQYKRMNELESALKELDKQKASLQSPLLLDKPPATSRYSDHGSSASDTDVLVTAFGVMSLGNSHGTQFHGTTAAADYVLQDCNGAKSTFNRARSSTTDEVLPPQDGISSSLCLYSCQFPCPPSQPPPDLNEILEYLPTYDRALALMQCYSSHFCWLSIPVPLNDLDDILHLVYPGGSRADSLDISDAHRLAVLLGVFLLGTLLDFSLNEQVRSRDVDLFLVLAKAAMVCYPVSEHTTLAGVQTMLILMWYFRLGRNERGSLPYQWCLTGLITKLIQSIGLCCDGRDETTYIQDPAVIARGEQTLWEYQSLDIWQSYMFGRPASMASETVQCKQPLTLDVYPGHLREFYYWKYSFATLVAEVVRATTSPDVDYTAILAYDKKLRHYCIPEELSWPDEPLPNNEEMGKTFQRCLVAVWKQLSIMYINRPYFWQLVCDRPEKPVRHRYWRSIVGAYHSASTLVSHVQRLWLTYPKLLERMVPFWSHAYTASLVLCALVTYSPGSQFAEGALKHFDETCHIFFQAEDSLQQPYKKSDMINMQNTAHCAFERFRDSVNQSQPWDECRSNVSVSPNASLSPYPDSAKTAKHHLPPMRGDQDDQPPRKKIKGMPSDYEVARYQEDGWDHMISQLGMDYSY
ncbi:hypothetical protein K439DRAFT_1657188 [Ramaria rubella]|nr:hypothetical protein K439DRAFT_1657188 [Ramaria rubella]